jgi:polyisoprenoid-binding protein YceI
VVLKTGRQGIAALAGHDLTIEVTRWSAQVEVPGDDITAATVKAEFDLGSLEVRQGTGGAKPLTDRDRAEIKKQMSNILGTGTATFASTRVVRFGASGGAVEGTLTLNGQSEPVRLQVSEPESGRYRGSATVVQSGLGIKPYVGFFGALKLKDEVGVEFEVTRPAAESA